MTYRRSPSNEPSEQRNVVPQLSYPALDLRRRQGAREGSLRWPALSLCLLSAACATSGNVPGLHQAAVPHVDVGVILSMRAVSRYPTQAPQLTAFRGDSGAAKEPGGAALTEFIVRADDGATLSIVQPNDLKFRAGDRVVIMHAAQTHLAPSS